MSEETRALEELMRDFKEHNTKYAKNYEDICYNAIQSLQQQLKDKDEKISKAVEYCNGSAIEVSTREYGMINVINYEDVLEILETNKED